MTSVASCHSRADAHGHARQQFKSLYGARLHRRIHYPDLSKSLELSLNRHCCREQTGLKLLQEEGLSEHENRFLRHPPFLARQHHTINLEHEIIVGGIGNRHHLPVFRECLAVVPPSLLFSNLNQIYIMAEFTHQLGHG
jgi:hypothetical protein